MLLKNAFIEESDNIGFDDFVRVIAFEVKKNLADKEILREIFDVCDAFFEVFKQFSNSPNVR